MANIKSAKKRVITSQVRADRNKAIKSKVKTYIKKVDAAVAAGDKAAAEAALPVAIAEIGFIYEIDVFSTSIRTYNSDLIIVPNGVIISDKIINYTKIPIRRLKFVIRVSYDCNIKAAREALEKLLRDNPLVINDPPIFSHVESYEEGFINIALKGWTKNENYWQVYWEVMNNLKDYLAENDIKLPTNKMDIIITQDSSVHIPK